jgi:drug/metabolite transporter (DMT)-like permease
VLTIVLALASAASGGVADFLGGALSRRMGTWRVVAISQTMTATLSSVVALGLGGRTSVAETLICLAGGCGTALGLIALYHGLTVAQMGAVITSSALGAALLPVGVGVAQGETLGIVGSAGIGCALVAIWLVSSDRGLAHDVQRRVRTGVGYGLVAGLGFGSLFVALSFASSEAGLVPIAITQVTCMVLVVAAALRLVGLQVIPRSFEDFAPALIGPFAWCALALFFFAERAGLLSAAGALSALYPVTTVLLARFALGERLHRSAVAGICFAVIGVALLALTNS